MTSGDIPTGLYDGPPDPDADAFVATTRIDLAGHPKDEVYRTLEAGLRARGREPRVDAVEVVAREVSYDPAQD